MRSIGAVILAAGGSTRLGQPKQLVVLGKENLLERSIRVAIEAGCSPVIVVLGASVELIREKSSLENAQSVINEDWGNGMGSSIRAGIAALPDVAGAILMTCDMPGVTAEHLRNLSLSDQAVGTCHGGRTGVPAFFPEAMFASLLRLEGTEGAKELLRDARSVELIDAEFDVDTRDDLKSAQARFQGSCEISVCATD